MAIVKVVDEGKETYNRECNNCGEVIEEDVKGVDEESDQEDFCSPQCEEDYQEDEELEAEDEELEEKEQKDAEKE